MWGKYRGKFTMFNTLFCYFLLKLNKGSFFFLIFKLGTYFGMLITIASSCITILTFTDFSSLNPCLVLVSYRNDWINQWFPSTWLIKVYENHVLIDCYLVLLTLYVLLLWQLSFKFSLGLLLENFHFGSWRLLKRNVFIMLIWWHSLLFHGLGLR